MYFIPVIAKLGCIFSIDVDVWCSRNIYLYYQCWKQLFCLLFLWKL